MKVAVISDIHGKSLSRFKDEVLSVEYPDLLLVLGDFDEVRTIREVMELEKQIPTIVVPGNHDYNIFHGMRLESDDLKKDPLQLHKEMHDDPEIADYVKNLLNNPIRMFYFDEGKFGKKYPVLAVHGALVADRFSQEDTYRILWERLKGDEDHIRNFDLMEKFELEGQEGFRIMLRGHDSRKIVYRTPDGRMSRFPDYTETREKMNELSVEEIMEMIVSGLGGNHPPLPIEDGSFYTITIGQYTYTNYCIISTDGNKPEISLKMLKPKTLYYR